MTQPPELLDKFDLPSPQNGGSLPVHLYRNIGPAQLTDFEDNWQPILLAEREEVRFRALLKPPPPEQHYLTLLGKAGIQDAHWNWRELMSASDGISHASFFITHEERLQAMMLIYLNKRCRLPEQRGQHLVYADRISVAPWCRRSLQDPPFLRGLGTLMLYTAVSLSLDEGYDGRVGLHSLAQSEPFYLSKNMTPLGYDENYLNLMYYEYTPANASTLLS